MKKIIYIFSVVGASLVFFLLGWYLHRPIKTSPTVFDSIPAMNNATNLNEYGRYVTSIDTICPFESTASTGECLDKEINKQKQLYNSLLKELIVVAGAKRTGKNGDGSIPSDMPFILNNISDYTKTRDAYIEQSCSFRNTLEFGSGVVEASRKCTMYYNAIDIQTLKGIISDLKNAIFPD